MRKRKCGSVNICIMKIIIKIFLLHFGIDISIRGRVYFYYINGSIQVNYFVCEVYFDFSTINRIKSTYGVIKRNVFRYLFLAVKE